MLEAKIPFFPFKSTYVFKILIFSIFLLSLHLGIPLAHAAPVRIPQHVPTDQIRKATHLGRMSGSSKISVSMALPLRDPAALQKFLQRIYDPADPLYGHFMNPEQFTATFAPTEQDANAVAQYLIAQGFSNVKIHPNRILIDAEGEVGQIENAFQLEMHHYQTKEGRVVYAPSSDPLVTSSIAKKISGVVGLHNFSQRRPYLRKLESRSSSAFQSLARSGGIFGSGPGGGLSPADIKKAYGLNSLTQTGAGQTLGLFECDGYADSDITSYVTYFGLTSPPLTKVLLNNFSGTPGAGQDEVVLDIEVMIAIAPGASGIIVYEGSCNTDAQWLNIFNRIASDNSAKQISISWGAAESLNISSTLNSLNTILQQMAAQGQSFFAASGDSGAFDNQTSRPNTGLMVDDPGSQPYITSVGGTTLSVNGAGNYTSETSWWNGWFDGSAFHASPVANSIPIGGGGGISAYWPIPSWQSNYGTSTNLGSASKRMVPDVALDADPNTGYAIYSRGSWQIFGGTSVAAPIWAAFTALVNQERAANSLSSIGFVNPTLYQLGQSSLGTTVFHDIADSSTNGYFPAVSGYDLSVGWGSFKGASLLGWLTTNSPLPPLPPTNLTVLQVTP